jgi:post-segregation antitoxin (ccd killing protein)
MPNQRKASQVAVTIYVDRDLKAAAKDRARERSETVTAVILRALRRYVR